MRFPLLVQIEYHPQSVLAAATADYLHAALNADPSVPGLQIPTCFTPDDGTGEPPAPRIADEADRVLVVLLSDDHLAVHARQGANSGLTWAEYAVRLRDLCATTGNRFVPVQLTEHGWPLDSRLEDLNFLRAWAIDDADERRKFIARRLVHLLIRRLRPREADEDAPPLTIFLSHTKLDLEDEPRPVKTLLSHLIATQPEKTWFDAGDIAAGSRFKKEIEQGVADAALLAVVTDSYSSRSWCRREVLLAKHYQRPVVVVDAVQRGEVRRFPYAGNTPVIRWNGQPQDVVDLLLRETLRHLYSEESLSQRKRPGDSVLPAGPELVTIVHRDKTQTILYPDPPLGLEELAILERAGISVETPLERHAKANSLRGHALTVAISVSPAEDLARFGLRQVQLDATFLELSRYLLLAGLRLAYGGHLQANGYTLRLVDLLRDPIIEQLRGAPVGAGPLPTELVTYIPWPTGLTVHEEARLGPLVDVQRCERPSDLDEALDTAFVPWPDVDVAVDSAARRFGWSRGLTAMRERQTAEVAARILVGGKLGPGYKGRMPGVLEEALVSLRARRPVYLIGAFGGCARLVFDALEGIGRHELTWDHQKAAPFSEDLQRIYAQRNLSWDDYDAISSFLEATGLAGLNNGLGDDENRELAKTRSIERIVELVLTGLRKLGPTHLAAV